VATSGGKYLPASSIKVGAPAADGTRTFTVTPVSKEKPKVKTLYKITISAEDKWGLKATPVVLVVEVTAMIPMMKLCTSDGSKRGWSDYSWWGQNHQRTDLHNEKEGVSLERIIKARKDVMTKEYNAPLGPVLTIQGYVADKLIGQASYNIKKEYQKASLRNLVSESRYKNHIIGIRDNSRSSTDQPVRKLINKARDGMDMFIDSKWNLRVWHDGLCNANQNIVRIGVDTAGSTLGCRHNAHTFGGIGGTHYQASWQVDFEAAPMTGYCNPTNRYGSDQYHRHNSHYVFSSCSQGGIKRLNLDYVILQG